MTDLLFDKLAYKDKLTASGVPEAQARDCDAMDEALRETMTRHLNAATLLCGRPMQSSMCKHGIEPIMHNFCPVRPYRDASRWLAGLLNDPQGGMK